MPTLDDITILQTNNKVAMNDPVAVVDKSSSGSSQVEQFPLGLAAQGFTHAYVINYDHTSFTGNTAGAASSISQAITLHTFSATERLSVVRAVCTELFAPASGETSNGMTIDVGETSDPDEFIDAFDVRTGSATVNTFIDNSGSAMTGTYTNPVIDDPANEDLIVTLTVGSSDNSVHINDLSAGQVVILADIFDIADYKDCVTPLHLQ
tara:strand:+ start:2125 stop:2748 length:624 start_codon:yes stop_codon:yes gene_type:complete